MLEQIFAGFIHVGDEPTDLRQTEPAMVTNIYTIKQIREGNLPDTQYGRLVAHSYSP
jgi:hypothetical protein